MGSRIPRALAKRLDRLARRAHDFHRFAHHPLCGAYRSELIALGKKTRICRGCSYAACGVLVGVGFALVLPPSPRFLPWSVALIASAAWTGLSSAIGARRTPTAKLMTRAWPLFALSLGSVFGLRQGGAIGLTSVGLALLVLTVGLVRYRARGPNRQACTVCPERDAFGACSGFVPILRRERAFARLARRWLLELR